MKNSVEIVLREWLDVYRYQLTENNDFTKPLFFAKLRYKLPLQNCGSVAFSQRSQTECAPVYVFQSQSRTARRRVRVAEADVADMERWRGERDGMLSQPSEEFRFLRPQR